MTKINTLNLSFITKKKLKSYNRIITNDTRTKQKKKIRTHARLENDCLIVKSKTYIGLTNDTLSRHLTWHLYDNSNIKIHIINHVKEKSTTIPRSIEHKCKQP